MSNPVKPSNPPATQKEPSKSVPSESITDRTVYGVQLSGSGDYGASAAHLYGVYNALEKLMRAEKRDKRFPRPPPSQAETDWQGRKLPNSRVEALRRKWDDQDGFDITYQRRVFGTQADMLQGVDMANSVPLDYDSSKSEDVAWVYGWEEPKTGTLSETDDDEDDEDGDESEGSEDDDEGMISEKTDLLPKVPQSDTASSKVVV